MAKEQRAVGLNPESVFERCDWAREISECGRRDSDYGEKGRRGRLSAPFESTHLKKQESQEERDQGEVLNLLCPILLLARIVTFAYLSFTCWIFARGR